jgi:CSLREA domain-containing protein
MLRNVILKEILGVRSAVWMVAIALLVALIVVGLLASGAYAAPSTFIVNSTNDPGTSGCDPTECTLREAIDAANANNNPTEKDRINFSISGTGVHTISPTSPLPQITEPVIINGYSQPGTSANTLAKGTNALLTIELDGTTAGALADGLGINAKNTVVKGLVINSFAASGIRLFGSAEANGTKIQGNFIGTNPAGTTAQGNDSDGIALTGNSKVTVGGTLPSMRNLISGSRLAGVALFNFETGTNNKVLGNLIGTDKDGSANLGNGNSGVFILAREPNNSATTVANNTIAFNGDTTNPVRATDGVVLFGEVGTTDTILSNSIFSNKGLGIDLIDFFAAGERGDTDVSNANDSCDSDEGTNDLQNKPNLTSALTSSGTTTIKGRLNSNPNEAFTVQFFRNPPGTNEGKTFLGQKSVSTDSNCTTGTFTFIPNQAVSAGQAITATATDSEGNTSEFSAPETVG